MVDSGYGVEAWSYPLWFVIEETGHIIRRKDAEIASQSLMYQMAMQTIPSMGIKPESTKTAQRNFAKQVKQMLEVS